MERLPLIGGWVRRSLRVAGGAPVDDSLVVWLQVEDWFADIRLPRPGSPSPPSAFSGQVSWRAPAIAFHHDLDDRIPPREDIAELRFEHGQMVETGVFRHEGAEFAFEEVWAPVSPETSRQVVWERSGPLGLEARYVETHGHGVLVSDQRPAGGPFGAALFRQAGSAWRRIGAVDAGDQLERPCDAAGWRVRVDRAAGVEAET